MTSAHLQHVRQAVADRTEKKQKWDRGWIRLDESNPNGLTLILGYDTMLLTLERVEERCSVSGDSYIYREPHGPVVDVHLSILWCKIQLLKRCLQKL